ncbi:helix-turn-helix domain-containing protein [Nocardioides limicola]|uniref:helix-turn-helix domain-containing protein n=1 Tax=Nocardioides limicola TaxID=2803368 RepID=UPI00193B4FE6|nr:helix-turn-helix domain-containing protein [Nocardioides sp. DJM-14]
MTTSLREHRISRALTPSDIAEQVGVHPTSILRWERGERLPGPTHIRRLARTLAIETAEVARIFDGLRAPTPSVPHTLRGHGLRPLRRRAGVPVVQLAEAVAVPAATVYNWESGRARIPLKHLPTLAAILDIDAETLRRLLSAAPAVVAAAGSPPSALRRLRRRTGLSQSQVAQRIGASRHSISTWERGQPPPLSALRRLANLYGVPVSTVARVAGVRPPRALDRRTWTPGDLHEVLCAVRQWAGLTQAEVAARLSCSTSAVRGWESARATPGTALRLRLERLYGLPAGALLTAYPTRR